MPKKKQSKTVSIRQNLLAKDIYQTALSDIKQLVQQARYASARTVNAIMTATYWEIGRRIVQVEQKGKQRAEYGEELIKKLAKDLTKSCGKGFGKSNLHNFRQFYISYSHIQKFQTVSGKCKTAQKGQTLSAQPSKLLKKQDILSLNENFPLPWSAYVRLMSVQDKNARKFYEEEALRGGWSVRQLNRQIGSQFYERTMLSKNKTAMLTKGAKAKPTDKVTPEEAVKDPYILEFLSLKDEYSESDLEESLIRHLEGFLIELGGDFAFVGRQKRLRIENDWFRVDLVFYHRGLNCLILIDLKVDDFTYADAGQMNMYLNYAKARWTKKNENPPVGLILCSGEKKTLVKYTLQGMSNKILTAKYQTKLPSPKILSQEIEKTKRILTLRKAQFPSLQTRRIKNQPKINQIVVSKRNKNKTAKKSKNHLKTNIRNLVVLTFYPEKTPSRILSIYSDILY